MKKTLSLILALIMMMSMTTAFAADLNKESKTGTTDVTYNAKEGYIVTIPQSITVDGSAQALNASNVIIGDGKSLKVSVTSANTWVLKHATADDDLAYTLTAGTWTSANTGDSVVLTVESGALTGNVSLSAALNDGVAASYDGDYSDIDLASLQSYR